MSLSLSIYIYIYVYAYVCMYVYIYVYIYIYIARSCARACCVRLPAVLQTTDILHLEAQPSCFRLPLPTLPLTT